MKKTLALLLTVIIFTGSFLTMPITSQAATGGSCGEDVQWEYAEGTLTISGTGYMKVYPDTPSLPWYNFINDITKLVINDGVKTIASFHSLDKIKEINIPDSVHEISAYTFVGCYSLEKVNLSNNLQFLGIDAFSGCPTLKEFTINNSLNGKTNDILGHFGDITGYFFVRDGILFSYSDMYYSNTVYSEAVDHFRLEKYPSGREGDTYIIPHDTMVVAKDAFSSLTHLNNIVVPTSVRSFEYLSIRGGLRDSDKPLNIVFQHNSYLDDMSHYAFHNLPKGSKIIVKNDGVKNQFIEKKSYYNYDYTGNEDYVSVVTKNIPCQSLSVDKTDVKLKIGESVTVAPSQSPIITTDNVSFISSNKKIVSIDAYNLGRITAVGTGKATVTVQSGNAKAIVNIEVVCEHPRSTIANVKKASCSEEGYTGDTVCADCGAVLVKGSSIPKEPHVLLNEIYQAPTCTARGYRIHKRCENCGYKEEPTTYYPALGHNWKETVVKKATCVSGAIVVRECTRCGRQVKEEKDGLGSHTIKTYTTKATASKAGSIVRKCSICGVVVSKKVIPKVSSVKLANTKFIYNNNVKKPAVEVKDSTGKKLIKGTDYTVRYASGRKNVGKYAVKITFKGNYSGTKTLYFTIKPKGTSISSLTAGSKKFTVKWYKRTAQVTGYQVQYSRYKSFSNPTTLTVTKNSTTQKTKTKLKAKQRYYVRVRTYKVVNGTKYYSSWSDYKSVITKA